MRIVCVLFASGFHFSNNLKSLASHKTIQSHLATILCQCHIQLLYAVQTALREKECVYAYERGLFVGRVPKQSFSFYGIVAGVLCLRRNYILYLPVLIAYFLVLGFSVFVVSPQFSRLPY